MKISCFILLASLLILASCNQDDPVPEGPKDLNLKEGSEFVIESMNDFGLDIFQLILADEPADKNVFISPTSISLALAMTLNGANGLTEDSMEYALRMDHLDSQQINETYRDLVEALLSADDKVILEIANSIWSRQGFPVDPEFTATNQEYYNAEMRSLDFRDPSAIEVINGWVANNTHNRIPEIINYIDPATVMFLINAIYFKGIWSLEFDEEDTHDGIFHLEDGTTKTTPMMHLDGDIGYYSNELFQACEMDYGRGNFSMMVFLPNPDVTMDDLVAALTPENLETWTGNFHTTEVNLALPKFTFDYEIMLNDVLKLMGMGIAFGGSADFSGINADTDLFISYVKHKTFVEVNEEGTEAAAVTVVAILETSVSGNYMSVDRPFLFAIREKTTNTLLFIGRVAEP